MLRQSIKAATANRQYERFKLRIAALSRESTLDSLRLRFSYRSMMAA
jgi:hypothetical protein